MLSDLDCANLCQAQYDGKAIFDQSFSINGVDFSIKNYDDCGAIIFEGSHDLPDWISNFDAVMVDTTIGGVEQGFYMGLSQCLLKAIPLLPKGKPIFVTGHSRGAAHAHLFAALLIKAGYDVVVVTFGSPRPGDARLAAILSTKPNRSYRNYLDFDNQDFVCDVPLPLPPLTPYVHPSQQVIINSPAAPGDSWGILSRHHLFLYTKALDPTWHTY